MFGQVLLPVDGSEASERARVYALVFAAAYDATVHALYVRDSSAVPGGFGESAPRDRLGAELDETAAAALDAVGEACEGAGVASTTAVRSGHPAEEILASVDDQDVDLVVLGRHSRGRLARFLHRSVGEQVARRCPVPVLTVGDEARTDDPQIGRILLAVDWGESARAARTVAVALGETFDATVHGLYVVDSRLGTSGTLRDLLEREGEEILRTVRVQGERAGVEVVPVTRGGAPEREIVDYANQRAVDLIVLGTHGRRGLDRFVMGSVATAVVRRADRPVLTVRPVR